MRFSALVGLTVFAAADLVPGHQVVSYRIIVPLRTYYVSNGALTKASFLPLPPTGSAHSIIEPENCGIEGIARDLGMRIEAHSFGKITIDGETSNSDVIIYPNRVEASWWRKEGHRLQAAHLTEVINERPEVLIIGTGHNGLMKVPAETVDALGQEGIEVHAEKTTRAVEVFNHYYPNAYNRA